MDLSKKMRAPRRKNRDRRRKIIKREVESEKTDPLSPKALHFVNLKDRKAERAKKKEEKRAKPTVEVEPEVSSWWPW